MNIDKDENFFINLFKSCSREKRPGKYFTTTQSIVFIIKSYLFLDDYKSSYPLALLVTLPNTLYTSIKAAIVRDTARTTC